MRVNTLSEKTAHSTVYELDIASTKQGSHLTWVQPTVKPPIGFNPPLINQGFNQGLTRLAG